MTIFQAIVIAIVEGITEFLPVSSTGHMMITQELLGMEINDFVKAFTVNIQFGAILSVIVLYWKKFFQSFDFYLKLFVAFIPAAILGFLASDFIDSMLENVVVVAVMLLLGGIILVFVDKWFNNKETKETVTYPSAFKIGLFQCIAMIPGVSRSAATIIGGMTQKLDRKTAAEFSFFLAVPTMAAASGYKLLKLLMQSDGSALLTENLMVLLVGNVVAFVVALLAIKTFIGILTKYGFKYFGYYRIVVGLVILTMVALGYELAII
jgi:undecaprenyl-diphosphatase